MLAYRLARYSISSIRGPVVLAGALLLCTACDATIGPPPSVADAAQQPAIDAPTGPAVDAPGPPPVADASPNPQVDASAPQADAPARPLTCDDQYGGADMYVLCEESPDTCRFSAWTGGDNCNALCAMHNGTCITAFDNDEGAPCVANQEQSCDTNADDEICVCSRN